MSAQNSTLRGLAFAFLGFAVFATHDVLIKVLGGTYSVLQIIFSLVKCWQYLSTVFMLDSIKSVVFDER